MAKETQSQGETTQNENVNNKETQTEEKGNENTEQKNQQTETIPKASYEQVASKYREAKAKPKNILPLLPIKTRAG